MSAPLPSSGSSDQINRNAAQWVAPLDRGLSASEQDDYSRWMAESPRHREAIARQRWAWDELDRLAGLHTSPHAHLDPDLLAPKGRRRISRVVAWVAPSLLAAALVGMILWQRPPTAGPSQAAQPHRQAYSLTAPCERQVLEDGSVAELNRGAAIEVQFTRDMRRLRLVRGEAKFTVAKNPNRPFVVDADGLEVQAVGTVFDVELKSSKVDVIVSEGTVKLQESAHPFPKTPYVHAGQEAVAVRGSGSAPAVVTLSDSGLSERLAWQPTMLHFDDLPLSDIVRTFNEHNAVQLRIAEPELEHFRLSAAFRSDNVEGFVRLMVFDFGMRADHPTEDQIVLRRAE